jgi:putative ABC transport system ATP-binding protein/macrolide transport system ATP-binding/permease protein
MSPDRVIEITGVARRFASAAGPVVALDGVDLVVTTGSFTVVAGPSGSGKSTLLGLAACIDRPDDGEVVVAGRDVLALGRRARRDLRRRRLGLVLPVPADNLLDSLDAAGNVVWAARERSGERLTRDRAQSLLDVVELSAAAQKQVVELSGGEQQRLAVACALVGDPAVVLADEPTASLDHDSAALVIGILRAAADRGATLLVASHDHHVLEQADVIVHLDHGRRVG